MELPAVIMTPDTWRKGYYGLSGVKSKTLNGKKFDQSSCYKVIFDGLDTSEAFTGLGRFWKHKQPY